MADLDLYPADKRKEISVRVKSVLEYLKFFVDYKLSDVAGNRETTYDLEDALEVGWDSTGILPVDDRRGIIFTRGVSCCFTVTGINKLGDIVMGHYYHSYMMFDKAMERIRTRIERYNLEKQKTIDFETFSWDVFWGPCNPNKPKTKEYSSASYNVFYIKGIGRIDLPEF